MAIQTTGLLFFLAIITSQQCLNLQLLLLLSFILLTWFLSTWLVPGGHAWCGHRNPSRIPGPAGYPVVGSLPLMGSLAHRNLARISSRFRSLKLMALSLGFTPVIIASHPDTAREILSSPAFVDRPVKRAARLLMFERAIGFSPHGEYWRSLRRAAAMCLFAPRRLAAQEACRQACISDVLREVEMCRAGAVQFRGALQKAARNSIAGSVFGELNSRDKEELGVMVREGYEILGGFDWGDYFPAGWWPDFWGIGKRSEVLAGKVRAFVGGLVEERRKEGFQGRDDFLSLMLGMAEEERIADSDMVALLWVSILNPY
ncbi:hypothetical protein AMTR_s00013p00191300 [Amborella trichopoda]|uniref:Cytochrome P450 n=1 Tax=Amborella trichopoda TaxID=13333 RepID=W1PPE9_AMBTC|nr:hypothetical protein AMTR_s00013p00191300 [Amborella trichopoda]